jgi:UDP-2-acetamido-3-amino-2,3-dideoxy-glucuronate N-acetyltransferase
MIHSLADVQSKKIGKNTFVWQYSVILSGAEIGENCNINCHTFIENDVVIGDNVTVKSGVYIWDGIIIHNDVFIGPNVTFTNDKYPKSKVYQTEFQNTIIHNGASIGAAAIILGGVTIGKNALVAAGALVTKNVPANTLVKGSPAKVVAYLDKNGNKLVWNGKCYVSNSGEEYYFEEIKL